MVPEMLDIFASPNAEQRAENEGLLGEDHSWIYGIAVGK
jgi:hypothetical protein